MSITKEQQQALDDALVSWEQRRKIGSCNYKLSTTFKPKESTFQVALDVLSNTPFHQAFLITASVPAIYMQEFWNIASYHKHTIIFKINKKSYFFDLDTFRNMLQICPKLLGQHFVDTPFEEDILAFMRELGYPRTIKFLSDVKSSSLTDEEVSENWCQSSHNLITPTMKESEAFKTYYDFATGKATPKPKYVHRTSKDKTEQAPKASTGKRLKATAKGAKSGKKRQPARGIETLSETHSSHASGSGTHEGNGATPRVPNIPTYESDDEEISWKTSSDDDDDNEGDDDTANDDHDDAGNQSKRTKSNNEGDEFVHLKFTTHDKEKKEEESSDPRVHTPSQSEPSDNEANVDVAQSEYTEEEEVNAEHTYEEEDANDLYRDLNVNLEGRDADMTDAPQTTQVIEDTHVTLTPVNPEGHQQSSSVSSGFISNMLNPNPDTGIDSILNTESTSLVEIPVTSVADTTPSFATTLPPPPLPLIQQRTQTPLPIPTTAPSTSLQDLPNFGSLFGFDNRLKALEQGFSEFIQTNQYATALSSIPNIVDNYLGSKLKEAVDVAVQLKSDRIREEAQAENEDFFNKVDENMMKIIKEQVNAQVKKKIDKILPRIEKLVNEQLESEVLIRASNEAKTSHAVAANLFKLELKKILIDKMKSNKSIDRSDEQKNLYKALFDAYEADKALLDAYGDTVTIKRRRDNADDDLEPSAGPDWGSKRRRAGKEPESSSAPREKTSTTTTEGSKSHQQSAGQSALAQVPMHTADDFEDPTHQDNLARQEDPRESFDELMDTPFDFSAFMMNRLKFDTLTLELLAGPTFELMKGTCKSLRYPHDLRKPLPLIPNSRGRQVIPFAHFINNDLAYLSGGVSSRTYSTSVTKTKAAYYGNIKWIEDLVPSSIWSEVPVSYDKYALWEISHWGRKRQQFYGFMANRESAKDVY
ncbi:hypothetical protein Tco_0760574 [Tanacetum coccineum]